MLVTGDTKLQELVLCLELRSGFISPGPSVGSSKKSQAVIAGPSLPSRSDAARAAVALRLTFVWSCISKAFRVDPGRRPESYFTWELATNICTLAKALTTGPSSSSIRTRRTLKYTRTLQVHSPNKKQLCSKVQAFCKQTYFCSVLPRPVCHPQDDREARKGIRQGRCDAQGI